MRTEIEVYLGDELLEFNADPKILYNYKITDNTNPTSIKNSFSKSITINGTARNNEIFGNIWDLSRIQGYEGDIRTGFNPQKKTPFTIYIDGNIYESGYAKLDTIIKKNNSIQYQITLYGGIGELFFNLTYKDEDGNEQRKLSDLQYEVRRYDGSLVEVIDMDFKINKDTIFDAWKQITDYSHAVYDESEVDRPNNYFHQNKWDFINFMPAYEGYPSDFDCNKVLMNSKGTIDEAFTWTKDGYSTGATNGFVLGEANEDLTCQETCDYRSYLQRPVIRLKEIIKACQNPINNGGWELKLDKTFFNDRNPYWEDTWVTLPMIRDCVEGGETEEVTEVTISPSNSTYFYDINIDTETLTEFTNINLALGFNWENTTTTTAEKLYLSYRYVGSNDIAWKEICRWYNHNGCILLQLVGYNAVNEVVAASDVHYLYSPTKDLNPIWSTWRDSFIKIDGTNAGMVTYDSGHFFKDTDGKYYWTNGDGKPTAIKFTFTEKSNISKIKLKVVSRNTVNYKYSDFLSPSNKTHYTEWGLSKLFSTNYIKTDTKSDVNGARNKAGIVSGKMKYEVVDANLTAVDYAGIYSNTMVRKKNLLSTEHTAADYLIAFAKMFGLYFYRDASETPSSDEYSKGVIHLLTRSSFYNKSNIIDIDSIVDRSRDIKITPSVSQHKWLTFNTEQVESEAEEEYKTTYNKEYGSQTINTGFAFNGDTKELLEKVIYKGGIEALETSKYYTRWLYTEAPYMLNGFKYMLYKKVDGELQSIEINHPISTIPTNSINANGWVRMDVFPKLQFHGKDNEPISGEDVIVFFKGKSLGDEVMDYGVPDYYITDDTEEMIGLNDGTPCWMYTVDEFSKTGKRIAYHLTYLPKFGRNIIDGDGNITHSLDMGNPRTTFIKDTFNTDGQSLYSKCWQDFIEDMYDDDNRILTCYVRFDGKPQADILRSFYWFDNCIWRMNSITDWNVAAIEPVKVEFIKVMDTKNYKVVPITSAPMISLYIPSLVEDDYYEYENGGVARYYTIEADETVLDVVLKVQGEGHWSFEEEDISMEYEDGTSEVLNFFTQMSPSNIYGNGSTVKKFTIPKNTNKMSRTITLGIVDDKDVYYHIYITQKATKEKSISVTPTSLVLAADTIKTTMFVYLNNRDKNDVVDVVARPAWLKSWSFGEWDDTDKSTLELEFEPNTGFTRSGHILLHHSGLTATIPVKQTGELIESISILTEDGADEIYLDSGFHIITLYVRTNLPSWNLADYPNYLISPVIEHYEDYSTLTFTVTANLRNFDRFGVIIVNALGVTTPTTANFFISQEGGNAIIKPDLPIAPLPKE